MRELTELSIADLIHEVEERLTAIAAKDTEKKHSSIPHLDFLIQRKAK